MNEVVAVVKVKTAKPINRTQDAEKIIQGLRKAGIEMVYGEKQPAHGMYSGIVGTRRKLLEVRI